MVRAICTIPPKRTYDSATLAAAPVEIAERKGIGHPDTICDALVEELSRALSRFYLERFGIVLHHNIDKGLLFGGAARTAFGGGEVLAPIELYLAGRAPREYRGVGRAALARRLFDGVALGAGRTMRERLAQE